MSSIWNVNISADYKADPEPTEDDKRAADYLELLLQDRIDDLIQWARTEKNIAAVRLVNGVKGEQ